MPPPDPALNQRILRRLSGLSPGKTMCPGKLAAELGVDPQSLRPRLQRLQHARKLRVTQRGREVLLDEVRGPYRVSPAGLQRAEHEGFAGFVGIDYSGAGQPGDPQTGIRVFGCCSKGDPHEITPAPGKGWSRRALHAWLARAVHGGVPLLIGIDHALGLPSGYARRKGLKDWDAVLAHMVRCWPADRMTVAETRRRKPAPPAAEGYRLCDRWTASAKSIFHFDVPGSVASSTFAGVPWIVRLRRDCGNRIHFWPFDGWIPVPGKSVVAEVYPSLWRRRFEAPELGPDARDARAVSAWLAWASRHGHLQRYWSPPLTPAERKNATVEGWILGVS